MLKHLNAKYNLLHLSMNFNSYADASGAGKDVYEFVRREHFLSALLFILLLHSSVT